MKTLVCKKIENVRMADNYVKAICEECKATIVCDRKDSKYKMKLCEECCMDFAMDGMLERKVSTKKVMGKFCYGCK